MRAFSTLLLLLLSVNCIAQNAAEAYYDPSAMQAARNKVKQMHGDTVNTMLIAERLENKFDNGEGSLVWEVQGWIGKDLNKLWLKSEGEGEGNEKSREIQTLWSRAISPFWDVQAGLRHDFKPDSRDYAVIGLMGLAPYWFELDAAAFVSDEGDVSARLEAEYELRFTQRLILQPRMEFNYAFSDDIAVGVGQGLNRIHMGLRLRYEIKREIAPYVGIAWEKSYGATANLLEAQGKKRSDVALVTGIRIWY